MVVKIETNKVGIAPYRCGDDGGLEFLLHIPNAKSILDQHVMKWGVARGTVRRLGADGAPISDLREMEQLQALVPEEIEDHWQTALQEMREELGLWPDDIRLESVVDCGLIDYSSERGRTYPIHFFACELEGVTVHLLQKRAADSQAVGWLSLSAFEALAAQGKAKAGYVPVLQSVVSSLDR